MTEETKSEYPEIRKLTRKDRKKLSELIQIFAERSGNTKLTEMIPGQGENKKDENQEPEKIYELIKSVLSGIFEFAEKEMADWFMDLTGINDRNVYDMLPFDIEMNIIDQMIAQKSFSNFFLRASEMYRKIRG